jgi:hypothetical protein
LLKNILPLPFAKEGGHRGMDFERGQREAVFVTVDFCLEEN